LQIAADLLEQQGEDRRHLAALGFLTVGRRFSGNIEEIINDRIDVVTRGLLGLSVSCARCHDHKYDPIPTTDFYALRGVFNSTVEPAELPLIGPADSEARAMTVMDAEMPEDSPVFIKGDANTTGPLVPRRFLTALSGGEPQPFTQGSGRLELARAIASRNNPLTARVLVNRIWMHHFGEGLVRTPSDFGRRSEPPVHPELLDYLASWFMDNGWSIKKLHRLIVQSATYQQVSEENPVYRGKDPDNRLWWKMNRRRLDVEAMRDALLFVAGQLDLTMGGPSVDFNADPLSRRRTIYGKVDRQNLPGMFATFDFANPDTHTPKRHLTTVPQQALFLLNSDFVLHYSWQLTTRPDVEKIEKTTQRIRQLYRLLYGRTLTAAELKAGEEFIDVVSQEDVVIDQTRGRWQYGYGRFDPTAKRITDFQPLPYYSDAGVWQGGPAVPDETTGWAMLWSNGGHPGEKPEQAVIRRWTAPRDGVISITATLEHPTPEGNGVLGRIVSSRQGLLRSAVVHNKQVKTNIPRLAVKEGETIDFVVECRGDAGDDSFSWAPLIRLVEPMPSDPAEVREWNSNNDFGGPAGLGAWGEYVQVLLLANEFVFLD
jgi:hypothetical protein